MSEMGDLFRDLHKQRQAKRAGNRESSASILVNRGIQFDTRNEGAHLIVSLPDGTKVDFWPGTGKWKFRAVLKNGYGVFNLIKEIDAAPTTFRINTKE